VHTLEVLTITYEVIWNVA